MKNLLMIVTLILSTTSYSYSIKSIIAKKGPPDQLIQYPDGTRYYTYYKKYRVPLYSPYSGQQVLVLPGNHAIGVPVPQTEIGSHNLILCETTYEVNSHGEVLGVEKVGKGCQPN